MRLLIDTLQDAVLIPTPALQRGSQGIFVYVVNNDMSVSVRPVTPGPALGEMTSIAKGLNAGEKVVVDGADKLREGGKVELITQGAAGGAGAGRSQGRRPARSAWRRWRWRWRWRVRVTVVGAWRSRCRLPSARAGVAQPTMARAAKRAEGTPIVPGPAHAPLQPADRCTATANPATSATDAPWR